MSSRVTRSQTRNQTQTTNQTPVNEDSTNLKPFHFESRRESLTNKLNAGLQLTQEEILEEGSTPHCYLDLRKTHNFVCKKNCTHCKGTGLCQGERGACGYGNEEYKCYYGRWVKKTKEDYEQEARMAAYYRSRAKLLNQI